MKINLVAIGNDKEAFIEDRFNEGMNIISSNDNNKGKTILIQGMMYALGNKPTFPTSFDYQHYHYIINFSYKGESYDICRFKNTFIIKSRKGFFIFENTSEFKRYWHQNIFPLPIIEKNGAKKIVDPVLYLQIFFVGQDKKETSNIVNKGQYNKEDFIKALYNLQGSEASFLSIEEIKGKKKVIAKLKEEKKLLLKQNKILKSEKKPISYLSSVNDRENFKKNIQKIETIKETLTELQKERNLIFNRMSKCEGTIKELNSLNREMESGKVVCLDCGSIQIGYKLSGEKSYTFDVSTPKIRADIMNSIKNKIEDYKEEIERITELIAFQQTKINDLLAVENVSLEALLIYKEDIFSAADTEKKILEIEREISDLSSDLTASTELEETDKANQVALIESILKIMNEKYKFIDPEGNLEFISLFTKQDEVFSGSEETIFQLVKIYSLASELKHDYPIIVDSFRAEDLSSDKEQKVIDLFSELNNQIILTTTLKKEESGKYDTLDFDNINHIDYTSHKPSKILDEKYVNAFKLMLSEFAITLTT
ncbi:MULTISPECIES: hypothetical protein [Lysinibacillus]|uniref:hypothetical protein n=1 Tax=Lysinibacillus TaxID=400634 RepID=UPI00083C9C2D|nr:hypothetical protein [Lysinibacillus xylanilyticus]